MSYKPETNYRSRSKGKRIYDNGFTSNININSRFADALGIKSTAMDMVRDLGLDKPAPPAPPVAPVVTQPFNPMQSLLGPLLRDGVEPPSKVMPEEDPIARIFSELRSMTSRPQVEFDPIQLPTFDPNRYKNQAQQAVDAQFNPIISAILKAQQTTQNRATTNKREVGDIYASLSNQIGKDAAVTSRGYDASQEQSRSLYEDERKRIAAAYAQDAAAQRAEAKRLGIESLGVTEAIAQQTADQRFADQMGSQQMQSSNAAFEQQQLAQSAYDKAMQQAARSEGAEFQQDIGRQLEDYMLQSDTNLAETRAQKAGSVQDLMMQLAQAAYQRDTANTQFGYQQQRDFIGDQNAIYDRETDLKMAELQMMQQMAQMQAEQTGAASAGSEKLNPYQQVATFAESLQPGQGPNIVAAIQKAMYDRPEIFARTKEDPVPMNPALFAKLIADSQAAGSLDRNSLMMVAQELYRLLYGVD